MDTDKIYAESIANEYSVKETSKVVALKKLDRKAKRPATVFAFIFGIIGTIIMGTGMSFALQAISLSGLSETWNVIMGSAMGILGIVMVVVNVPIYRKLRERGKKKYAFDIIQLAKEICETEHFDLVQG